MAMKWTANYVSPKDGGAGPAHKTNEWDHSVECIQGCSVSNAGSSGAPFGATVKPFSSEPHVDMIQGLYEYAGTGFRFGPNSEDYSFTRDWGKGNWGCFQMQWTGWGTSSAEARYWINGRQILHMKNFDMSKQTDGATDGIAEFKFNNFYNGTNGTDSGYPGSSIAYRLEDNIVVTSGAAVSCAAIGFATPSSPRLLDSNDP